jgi:GWxTD domain-containing protein
LPVSNRHPGLRRVVALALALVLRGSPGFHAQTAAESALIGLFAKAKAQFRGGAYGESLATLEKVDVGIRAPGLEAARDKIAPVVAFYRGANLAALGRTAEAKKEFDVYLATAPATKLDPAMYPRSVLDAFDAEREALRRRDGGGSAGSSALADAFVAFRAAPALAAAVDQTWGESAVRFLMTKEEKADWSRLSEPAARGEFVALFWQRRDPSPETPENEYRDQVERRIEFADAHFAQGEKKGSLTDRGMVFVLMGPPSYVASVLLKIEDDPIQAARSAPRTQVVTGPTGRAGTLVVTPQPMTAEKIQGTREFWHYLRDRVPRTVVRNEVILEFVTKEGYGTAVLQRDGEALATLELAASERRPGAAPQ